MLPMGERYLKSVRLLAECLQGFERFSFTPCAAASIGQVHRARLRTGEHVVVKVQHQAIEHNIRVDLDIMAGLAVLASTAGGDGMAGGTAVGTAVGSTPRSVQRITKRRTKNGL